MAISVWFVFSRSDQPEDGCGLLAHPRFPVWWQAHDIRRSRHLLFGFLDQDLDMIRFRWITQQVALNLVHGELAQQLELFLGLDTLGDDLDIHRMCHRNQRLHDLLVIAVGADIVNEAAIDLEAVYRQGFKIAQ